MTKRAKRLHSGRNGEHILVRIRRTAGEQYKLFPDAVGLPLDTIKSLTRQKHPLPFSESLKKRVAEWTGVSLSSLRNDYSTKRLTTSDGEPFTRDTWLKHRGGQTFEWHRQKRSPGAAGTCLAWHRILSIKIARVLAVALAEGKSNEAFFKIREAIAQVGRSYRQFDNLQNWDHQLQSMVGGKMAKGKKALLIWKNFEGLIAYVKEGTEKKPALKKTIPYTKTVGH
jgi:hypothetical protein